MGLTSPCKSHGDVSVITATNMLSPQKPPPGERRLDSMVVQMMWARFGIEVVEMLNHQPTACYGFPSQNHLDALATPCPDSLLYAFLLIPLLLLTLHRMDQCKHTVLFVDPYWPRKIWFPMICQLLNRVPWLLLLKQNFLSQLQGSI